MNEKLVEQLGETGKSTYGYWRRFGEINTELMRRLGELQMNLASLGIESSAEQLKLLSANSNYKEVMQGESELLVNYGSRAVDLARESLDVLNDSREELLRWVEESCGDFVDKQKAASS